MKMYEFLRIFLHKVVKHGQINKIPVLVHHTVLYNIRVDLRVPPIQWETSLQSNAVSHWLGTNFESALNITEKARAINGQSMPT